MAANMQKRVPVIDASINNPDDGLKSELVLTFSNGKTLTLRQQDLPTHLVGYAIMHGLKQKLVDAAAISRNSETGRPATPDDKYEAVKVVYDRLVGEGKWNATREGGGAMGGLLLKALVRMYPAKTAEQLREYLDGKTDAEKSALRRNPKIAEMIETIRAEAGKTANIDTDAMLDELGE